jgi:HAD superfamily hydrolase (TIGR01459 family)
VTGERCDGIAAIADRYELFLVDQFGVLHDGRQPYPGVVDCLQKLAERGRRVVLLSNSGKLAATNIARLVGLGIPRAGFVTMVTSGDVAREALATRREPRFAQLGRRCLLLSRGGDRSIVDGLDLELVPAAGDADFILLSGVDAPERPFADYAAAIEPGLARGLPLICANPDMQSVNPGGVSFGAGLVALRYRERGGEVRFIGKPHPEIYRYCFERLGATPAEGSVAVGDSVEHDIAGGRRAGLATVFVTGGLCAGKSDAELAALYRQFEAVPDWVVPLFRW